ncbi:MAG: hypothetical protein WCO77_06675 [bacterium]
MDNKYVFLVVGGLLALGTALGFAEDSWKSKEDPGRLAMEKDWRVKDAPVRFLVDLDQQPTHPSAGYFFTIPDGGILPVPFPQVQVFDDAGAAVKSAILWQSVNTGVGVVVAQPPSGGRTMTVYVSGGPKLSLWSPDSGLTPSALVCTYPGHGSRSDATRLSQLGQVEATVHFRNQPGSKEGATVALPGDRSGRPGTCAMYMLAYVNTKDPGDTWISPKCFSGQMDIVVDGRPISMSKKNDKEGGTGGSINLSGGLHRLELFGYNSAGGATGPLLLTWRTPKTSVGQLGGVRPSDLRYAGTSMWETRQLQGDEVVRSGGGTVRNAQRQDGGPVAVVSLWPENVFWFGGEPSGHIQYRFRAQGEANPKETKYSWSFAANPGAAAPGRDIPWLVLAPKEQVVTLKAQAGDKESTCSVLFYPFTDAGSSMNNAGTRQVFREAALTMLKAYPADMDVAAQWDATMVNNYFRVLDLAPEDPLLDYMVTVRWASFSKKLPLERKEMLEDLFLQETAFRDPKRAFKCAGLFADGTKVRQRKLMMQLKQAEILMYYQNDLDLAEKYLKSLEIESGEVREWALIRLGDLEFLRKNLNGATQLYGNVQDRSKHGKSGVTETEGVRKLKGPTLGGAVKASDFAKIKKLDMTPKKTSENSDPAPMVAAWKLSAIRDVAASEDVRNLMEQGFYLEAWQALRRWEREFPLSKLSSDLILQEGTFLIWQGDFVRAKAILSAYCEQVDASNFVPKALRLVVRCMIEMREPEAEITKYEKEISKRMEFRTEQE